MMVHGYSVDQTFIHKTTTHEYRIRWTRFGKTTSPALVFIHAPGIHFNMNTYPNAANRKNEICGDVDHIHNQSEEDALRNQRKVMVKHSWRALADMAETDQQRSEGQGNMAAQA